MKAYIRNLSARAEFCLIMLVGFAPVMVCQIWQMVHSERVGPSNDKLVEINIVELVVLAAVLWIGKIRGWSLTTFGSRISWKGTGGGILLFVVTFLWFWGFSEVLMHIFHPAHPHVTVATAHVIAGGLTLPFILLHSAINPVFEEVLEAGYFIRSLQRFGMWPAILASALFRAFFHWWLGIGAVGVFGVAIIFGFAYWRWRQLWPLIVAHALNDVYGLLILSHRAA
jgi:membrane protease YdiL (CAAX protease family)